MKLHSASLLCCLLAFQWVWCQGRQANKAAFVNGKARVQFAALYVNPVAYHSSPFFVRPADSYEEKDPVVYTSESTGNALAANQKEAIPLLFKGIKFFTRPAILKVLDESNFGGLKNHKANVYQEESEFISSATSLPLCTNNSKRVLVQMQPLIIDPVQASFSIYFSTRKQRPYFFKMSNTIGLAVQSLSGAYVANTVKVPQWNP